MVWSNHVTLAVVNSYITVFRIDEVADLPSFSVWVYDNPTNIRSYSHGVYNNSNVRVTKVS